MALVEAIEIRRIRATGPPSVVIRLADAYRVRDSHADPITPARSGHQSPLIGIGLRLHERDKTRVMRPDPCVSFWSGETKNLLGCLNLVCTGGHFAGFQVLHRAGGAGGKGALMAGDQHRVCIDPRKVSFKWSYPNMISLNSSSIRHVKQSLSSLKYDRLYGAFVARSRDVVLTDAKGVVDCSADRYLKAIEG